MDAQSKAKLLRVSIDTVSKLGVHFLRGVKDHYISFIIGDITYVYLVGKWITDFMKTKGKELGAFGNILETTLFQPALVSLVQYIIMYLGLSSKVDGKKLFMDNFITFIVSNSVQFIAMDGKKAGNPHSRYVY